MYVHLLSEACKSALLSRYHPLAPERLLDLMDQLTQRGRCHRNFDKLETLSGVLHEPDTEFKRFAVGA